MHAVLVNLCTYIQWDNFSINMGRCTKCRLQASYTSTYKIKLVHNTGIIRLQLKFPVTLPIRFTNLLNHALLSTDSCTSKLYKYREIWMQKNMPRNLHSSWPIFESQSQLHKTSYKITYISCILEDILIQLWRSDISEESLGTKLFYNSLCKNTKNRTACVKISQSKFATKS